MTPGSSHHHTVISPPGFLPFSSASHGEQGCRELQTAQLASIPCPCFPLPPAGADPHPHPLPLRDPPASLLPKSLGPLPTLPMSGTHRPGAAPATQGHPPGFLWSGPLRSPEKLPAQPLGLHLVNKAGQCWVFA